MSQLSKARQVLRKKKALVGFLETALRSTMELAIESQFRNDDGKLFNDKHKLRRSSGASGLEESLRKSLEKAVVKDGEIQFTLSSPLPYAKIQDKGGFIKATPTKNSKGVQTYKMAQYFWYKYSTSTVNRRKEFYKIMALSVQKKGGVNIKGKDYIKGAIKEYEKLSDKVIEKFIDQVFKIYG